MALAYAFLLAHSWQADTLKLILPGSLQEGLSGTRHEPLRLKHGLEPGLAQAMSLQLSVRVSRKRVAVSERHIGGCAVAHCYLQTWNRMCLVTGGFSPQFFPKLEGIMSLFSRGVTAASLWVHLLAINLFSARTILREGANTLTIICHAGPKLKAQHAAVCTSEPFYSKEPLNHPATLSFRSLRGCFVSAPVSLPWDKLCRLHLCMAMTRVF